MPRLWVVSLFAVALLTVACLDDGPTKAEFVSEAEVICGAANARARVLGAEPAVLTPAHARWLLALTSSDRRALDELAELERPPADRATIGRLVTELRAGLAYGERIARASRTRDEPALRAAVAAAVRRLGEGQLTAADYGLAHCARLSLVSRGG